MLPCLASIRFSCEKARAILHASINRFLKNVAASGCAIRSAGQCLRIIRTLLPQLHCRFAQFRALPEMDTQRFLLRLGIDNFWRLALDPNFGAHRGDPRPIRGLNLPLVACLVSKFKIEEMLSFARERQIPKW